MLTDLRYHDSWWYRGIKSVVGSMMTSSNGNIFRVTGPLCGEFTGPGEFPTQRPVTRSLGVFFDLHLNKRLSKQPRGWWFETPSWSLWRQCNVSNYYADSWVNCHMNYIMSQLCSLNKFRSGENNLWYPSTSSYQGVSAIVRLFCITRNAARFHYKTVKYTQNWLPRGRPKGPAMGCLLWVQSPT